MRQIRVANPMPSAAVHADCAELNCYTKHVTAGVTVQFRSHNSKVDKIESVRKSEKVSDLRRADRGR